MPIKLSTTTGILAQIFFFFNTTLHKDAKRHGAWALDTTSVSQEYPKTKQIMGTTKNPWGKRQETDEDLKQKQKVKLSGKSVQE